MKALPAAVNRQYATADEFLEALAAENPEIALAFEIHEPSLKLALVLSEIQRLPANRDLSELDWAKRLGTVPSHVRYLTSGLGNITIIELGEMLRRAGFELQLVAAPLPCPEPQSDRAAEATHAGANA